MVDLPVKTCFLISPIGKEGSPTRGRANKFQKYVVERVLCPRGYLVERADQLGEPGLITNQIVKRIVDCDLLVADLTDHNANVFYELAVRHGLKKPFVHFIAHDQNIPFDNLNVRAIPVGLTDLDSVEEACSHFSRQVDAIESPNHAPESPISVAFDLELLRTSGKPDDTVMVQILEQVNMLRHDMRRMQRNAGPRSASSMRDLDIQDASSMVTALRVAGHADLAEYINDNVTVDKVDYPEIILSPDPGKDIRDLTDDLSRALLGLTRKPWKVIQLPF